MNHKRVYRLYSVAKVAVRKRKKVRRPASERMPLRVACSVNEVWSTAFVSDGQVYGRRIKCLTVADDFSHECVDIATDFGIGDQYVLRLFDQAALFRGYPEAVRTDNAGRFAWLTTILHLLRPGVHLPIIHRLDADPRDSSPVNRAGSPHVERLHRELQRQVPRRMPKRALVRIAASGTECCCQLAAGLQRGQAAQQLQAHATRPFRGAASAASRRSSATEDRGNTLTLNPDFSTTDWSG